MKKLIESKWIQELTIVVFSFTLFTLNDWILISSMTSFFLGIVYFMVLYGHAQINRFILLPVLLKKHNTFLYLLSAVGLLLIFAWFLKYLSISQLYDQCFLHKNPNKMTYPYQVGILLGSFVCIIGSTQFVEYYRSQKKELVQNKNQIDFLNKQLNPHFLFNTLNTIYGVSLKYPEKTPDLIMRVSELLRYQVENCKKELVTLEDEIQFISSYIDLEKERMGYRCKITFEHAVHQPAKCYIAPMLLFTFIENAFKHGTRNIEDCFVEIRLFVEGATLRLETRNALPKRKPNIFSTKVGLPNTKTRLEMLYPQKHTLKIEEEKEVFHVSLEIYL